MIDLLTTTQASRDGHMILNILGASFQGGPL